MSNSYVLHQGDCLEILRGMPDCSIDSVVCDPPYGLSFMGRKWDYDVPSVEIWAECLRVLKPGGHLLAFAGTRTQHRMAVRIEDAGFEIRDMIAWVYGSGFPKSLDVSKAIDKRGGASVAWFGPWFRKWREDNGVTQKQVAELFPSKSGGLTGCVANWELGLNMPTPEQFNLIRDTFGLPFDSVEEAERDVVGRSENGIAGGTGKHAGQDAAYGFGGEYDITAPATDAARQWQGWGTALKPALETVTFASKPYSDEQERDIIQSNLIRLESRLWLLSSASAVEKSSASSQSEYGAACAIAQWSADEITSTRGALCAQMDTSLFELATNTSLSIASSWRRTLAESWSDGSMCITETRSSTTIDWKTLKFSLSQITPESIIRACSLPGGFSANASTAESHFNASLLLLQSIRTLSATEPVISQERHEHRGAGVMPNLDPCIMARKPLTGTVAENVLAHGTGALNIDGCRVVADDGCDRSRPPRTPNAILGGGNGTNLTASEHNEAGRWPANLIHSGEPEVLAAFPESSTTGKRSERSKSAAVAGTTWGTDNHQSTEYTDSGSAARFFYCAKASKADRGADNVHPTVKPTDLMRYLCRLVTPPGGTVLDPFTGSGSTGKAAILEGFKFIGCELSEEYIAIARARIEAACAQDDEQQDLFA